MSATSIGRRAFEAIESLIGAPDFRGTRIHCTRIEVITVEVASRCTASSITEVSNCAGIAVLAGTKDKYDFTASPLTIARSAFIIVFTVQWGPPHAFSVLALVSLGTGVSILTRGADGIERARLIDVAHPHSTNILVVAVSIFVALTQSGFCMAAQPKGITGVHRAFIVVIAVCRYRAFFSAIFDGDSRASTLETEVVGRAAISIITGLIAGQMNTSREGVAGIQGTRFSVVTVEDRPS